MKKTTKLWFMLAMAGIVAISSCKKKKDEDPEPTTPTTTEEDVCATANFPSTTGDATIDILNFSSSTIEVEAGNTLSLAVEVTKNSQRAKKIRLFQSDCENTLGDEVDLSDQPKGGSNGIDLRRTDDAQVRNVNYDVPTGFTTIYLNIEIEEAGDKFSYKRLTLDVSGSGVVDTWADVELGANANTTSGPNSDGASRMSSGTGQTYSACNAGENMDYIDITYKVNTTSPYPMYLCSNPARFASPVGSSGDASSASCGDDGNISTAGGNASYFVPYSGSLTIADATDSDLGGLAVDNTNDEYVEVTAVGDMFEFMSNDGRKGLIEVTAINQANSTLGSMTVSVKIQR